MNSSSSFEAQKTAHSDTVRGSHSRRLWERKNRLKSIIADAATLEERFNRVSIALRPHSAPICSSYQRFKVVSSCTDITLFPAPVGAPGRLRYLCRPPKHRGGPWIEDSRPSRLARAREQPSLFASDRMEAKFSALNRQAAAFT